MENELKLWIDNLIKIKSNNEISFLELARIKALNNKILFLDNVDSNELINIKNKYDRDIVTKSFLEIIFLDGKIRNQIVLSNNPIVCLKVGDNFLPDNFFIRDIIYVKSNKELINLLEDIIVNSNNKINLDNFKYDCIKKINIKTIIENKEELFDKIRERKRLLKSITGIDFDLDKSVSFLKNDIVELSKHINFLKEKNILTASFAHYLYKIFMLDFNSSTTKVGLKISKSLNSRSKTFSYKSLTDIKSDNYNLKAYDLNINQIEIDTKIKIAKNLLTLKEGEFNNKIIAKVTELSEKDILKLYKDIIFSNFK